MNCPNCNHYFTYLGTWKIINPNNCHCPNCITPLELNRFAKKMVLISAVIVIMLVLVAIGLEGRKIWTTANSLIYFLIVLPPMLIVLSYILWRFGNFQIRNYKNGIVNERILLNLMAIPLLFLILSFFSIFFAFTYPVSVLPESVYKTLNDINEGTFQLPEDRLIKIIKLNIEADIAQSEEENSFKNMILQFSFLILSFAIMQIFLLLIFYKQTKESVDNMCNSKKNTA